MMHEEILASMGLTKNEAEIYLLLLKEPESLASRIARKTRISRPHVYDTLNKLAEKGLASYVIKNGNKYFKAVNPRIFEDLLDERKKKLSEAMPFLLNSFSENKSETKVEVYEGKEGIKSVFNDIIREKKDFVGFGATDRAMQLLPDFTKRYLKLREKYNIKARQLYNQGGSYLKTRMSQFKPLPKEFSGPATTLVYGRKVAIFMWFTEEPIAVVIESRQAAKAYKNYFELMWASL